MERQSDWVGKHSSFVAALSVHSPLPSDELALSVQVFSRQLSRYALEHQPHEGGPTETLTSLPLPAGSRGGTDGTAGPLTLPVTTVPPGRRASGRSRRRALRLVCIASTCEGDYPLEFRLTDRRTHQVLATLDTTLVYVATAPTRPLDVALDLTFDLPGAALGPGAALPRRLSAPEATTLADTARIVRRTHADALSISVYGRLLKGLEDSLGTGRATRPATRALRELRLLATASPNVELLRTPFAPIDLNGLVAGLGPDGARNALIAQLGAADALTAQVLHATAPPTPFLSPAPLSPGSASILGETGVCDLALLDSDLALTETNRSAVAPFNLANTNSACLSGGQIGVAIDTSDIRDTTGAAADPVLAAHRLLADLAQTYFEDPNAPGPRAVVVAPGAAATNPIFVSVLLGALRTNPVLQPVTLAGLFSTVPVGANSQPVSVSVLNGGARSPVARRTLAAANGLVGTIAAITPGDRNLLGALTDEIYNGESFGLSAAGRARYLDAPDRAIARIAHELHLSGSSHVTFTATTGKIPITIHYTGPVLPVHVDLKIKSSSIEFPPAEAREHLVLSYRDTNRSLTVSTRTSGVYTFHLELLVPHRKMVLFGPATFTITSTAVSGVAIGLSAAALAVLGLWWYRSIRRRRGRLGPGGRRGATDTGGGDGAAGEPPARTGTRHSAPRRAPGRPGPPSDEPTELR